MIEYPNLKVRTVLTFLIYLLNILKHIVLVYNLFKNSFSKFCELRPKWCVFADSHDTHSVCVCSIHQNAILLVDALDVQAEYKDLLSKLVCSLEYSECIIHRCEKCPGSENLIKYIDIVICEKMNRFV